MLADDSIGRTTAKILSKRSPVKLQRGSILSVRIKIQDAGY
jgi:hypothetical protein